MTLESLWQTSFEDFKNVTLHNYTIYTQSLHLDFYIIICLLVVLLLAHVIKTSAYLKSKWPLHFFQPVNGQESQV